MATIINIDRLEIYRNYGGDIDGLIRLKKERDLDTFGSDIGIIWVKLTSFLQDIELIEKGLVSKEYADKAINEIKASCDKSTFDELTKNIAVNKITLLDIIKDYQLAAQKAVHIFKNKYKVDDILEG